jgi:hypothetical protein
MTPLEAAKSGDFSGITDPTEKARLIERFQQEGQNGLASLVESLQKKVTQGPVNAEQLATNLAEQQLGTNAKGTLQMEMGVMAARNGVELALAQTHAAPQTTPEATNQ